MTHWTEDLTNVPASVRERLRNIARDTGENMQVILARYATERLMYRLSRSDYRERFVLRGAWLFYLWGIPRRATRDVDFLAQVDNVHERAKEVFREVSQLDVSHNDGLHFDLDSIRVQEIQEDRDYAGLRLTMTAYLGETRIHTQVDLGFDEALTEEPMMARLPVLLDYEAPEIQVYSPEAVVAEKLEAIVKLGTINTRFKDFFDLYILSREQSFEAKKLQPQIGATFSHRNTDVPTSVPRGLSDAFGHAEESQRQWRAFLRRDEAEGAPEDFSEVIGAVREFAYTPLEAIARGRSLSTRW